MRVLIRGESYQALNAVHWSHLVKRDQQSDREAATFHVTSERGFVERQYGWRAFELESQAILDEIWGG